jgi:hypothetical protein
VADFSIYALAIWVAALVMLVAATPYYAWRERRQMNRQLRLLVPDDFAVSDVVGAPIDRRAHAEAYERGGDFRKSTVVDDDDDDAAGPAA